NQQTPETLQAHFFLHPQSPSLRSLFFITLSIPSPAQKGSSARSIKQGWSGWAARWAPSPYRYRTCTGTCSYHVGLNQFPATSYCTIGICMFRRSHPSRETVCPHPSSS
ncbi:unnamed protein product, partial [Tuber aestivum]